ncbi:MAG: IMP cyclohydrolase [Spirochaetaceae bacterium]|nr:MAG: IMP cyclohydrolase [Spirochaetaceae bacterium]
MKPSLGAQYRAINRDSFPARMDVSFASENGARQTLCYEKVLWRIGDELQGLRYGENPTQPAALYRLTNGNLTLGEVRMIAPGCYLASDMELLQSGKHPGKINITDVDSALGILRYFSETPTAVIVKHNNPCGVAKAAGLEQAYVRALMADRIAAFGGAVTLNRAVDRQTAAAIAAQYVEVVAAPDYEEGALEILTARKNLRVLRIAAIERLQEFVAQPVLDFKSLVDGGLIVQWSFVPQVMTIDDFQSPDVEHDGRVYRMQRAPSAEELDDMLFGWLVETGVTSNSVIYVKDGATVGIGTGEQDRVGVAEIARDKAHRKYADRLAWERYGTAYSQLDDCDQLAEIDARVAEDHGGLKGAVMVSDAFFPFRDGVDVGIREGVRGVVQSGGSVRDWEVIEACNEAGVSMVFTAERCFRH